MVARQLKIVSQTNAFMISATKNIQYVLKKLVGLIVFEKGIFDIYLNNICHIVFSLYLVRECLCEHWLYALPSNKIRQNFTNFQIHEDCVAMETYSFIPIKEFNIYVGFWYMQCCISIIRQLCYVFYYNCVNMNVGGVNYRS